MQGMLVALTNSSQASDAAEPRRRYTLVQRKIEAWTAAKNGDPPPPPDYSGMTLAELSELQLEVMDEMQEVQRNLVDAELIGVSFQHLAR